MEIMEIVKIIGCALTISIFVFGVTASIICIMFKERENAKHIRNIYTRSADMFSNLRDRVKELEEKNNGNKRMY